MWKLQLRKQLAINLPAQVFCSLNYLINFLARPSPHYTEVEVSDLHGAKWTQFVCVTDETARKQEVVARVSGTHLPRGPPYQNQNNLIVCFYVAWTGSKIDYLVKAVRSFKYRLLFGLVIISNEVLSPWQLLLNVGTYCW